MKYRIDHKTIYEYSAPVLQSHHLLHLSPRETIRQKILAHSLIIDPAPASRKEFIDFNHNPTAIVNIEQEHSHLQFHSHSEIKITGIIDVSTLSSPSWNEIADKAQNSHDIEMAQYVCLYKHTKVNEEIIQYAEQSFTRERLVLDAVRNLTERIFQDFSFDNSATDVSTPVSEVMKIKRGVCQDFAHLQLTCMRAMGVPARYVSGYILTKPPEGMKKLAGTDASHAWISAWCGEEIGWVDFDPTNNMVPQNEHIAFAFGRDYDDISPISGVLIGGGDHTVQVAVDVVPVS